MYVYINTAVGIYGECIWNCETRLDRRGARTRQTEDGLFWIGGSPPRQRILNRVAAPLPPRPLPSVRGLRCSAPPPRLSPFRSFDETKPPSPRIDADADCCGITPWVSISFFFFLEMEFGILERGFVVSCCRFGTYFFCEREGIGECGDYNFCMRNCEIFFFFLEMGRRAVCCEIFVKY